MPLLVRVAIDAVLALAMPANGPREGSVAIGPRRRTVAESPGSLVALTGAHFRQEHDLTGVSSAIRASPSALIRQVLRSVYSHRQVQVPSAILIL